MRTKKKSLTDSELVELRLLARLWAVRIYAVILMKPETEARSFARGRKLDQFIDRTRQLCRLMKRGKHKEALLLSRRWVRAEYKMLVAASQRQRKCAA